jgi:hypothetical protein
MSVKTSLTSNFAPHLLTTPTPHYPAIRSHGILLHCHPATARAFACAPDPEHEVSRIHPSSMIKSLAHLAFGISAHAHAIYQLLPLRLRLPFFSNLSITDAHVNRSGLLLFAIISALTAIALAPPQYPSSTPSRPIERLSTTYRVYSSLRPPSSLPVLRLATSSPSHSPLEKARISHHFGLQPAHSPDATCIRRCLCSRQPSAKPSFTLAIL